MSDTPKVKPVYSAAVLLAALRDAKVHEFYASEGVGDTRSELLALHAAAAGLLDALGDFEMLVGNGLGYVVPEMLESATQSRAELNRRRAALEALVYEEET